MSSSICTHDYCIDCVYIFNKTYNKEKSCVKSSYTMSIPTYLLLNSFLGFLDVLLLEIQLLRQPAHLRFLEGAVFLLPEKKLLLRTEENKDI